MSNSKFIAVDLGAESGRVVVGILEKETIALEEIHRFPNTQLTINGHKHWDAPYLFSEMKKGFRLAVQNDHGDVTSIGVDTWGVDYGLMDKHGNIIGAPFVYRDKRTDGMMERVFGKISRERIYCLTGIQFMQINTLFQLYSAAASHALPDECNKILFMPDLLNYFLTGQMATEYTIASTSQLLNAKTKNWDAELFSHLGLPIHLMAHVIQPGTTIGKLLPGVAREVGLSNDVEIIAVGCHDTASAVAAIPAAGTDWAYLSSGTWSLVGVELNTPIITSESMHDNFTNEGGVGNTIRFLHNVMGLWILQECSRSWKNTGSSAIYESLLTEASDAAPFAMFINPNDDSFLNPADMPKAIHDFCVRTGQPVPGSRGAFVRCICESLAFMFKHILSRIESVARHNISTLHIVGGGSRNEFLNQCTADACGVTVLAGPAEATALGNILVQAVANGSIASLQQGRELVACSFVPKIYTPRQPGLWDQVFAERFVPLLSGSRETVA